MRDPHSTDSRGFGFINFKTAEEAEAALALDGAEFMGKNLIVQKVVRSNKAKRSRARTPTPGQYRGPIKERRG
jgi:transformer-2 protein